LINLGSLCVSATTRSSKHIQERSGIAGLEVLATDTLSDSRRKPEKIWATPEEIIRIALSQCTLVGRNPGKQVQCGQDELGARYRVPRVCSRAAVRSCIEPGSTPLTPTETRATSRFSRNRHRANTTCQYAYSRSRYGRASREHHQAFCAGIVHKGRSR
jgi:hypothetical protein